MSKGALCWYRVEFGPDRKLVDIRAVDLVGEGDGARVFFYRATSAKEAGRLAFRAYQLADSRRRRAEYLAAGRCQWCGRPNDRDQKARCSVCLESHLRSGRRARAIERGEVVEPIDRRKTVEANREAEREALRREIRLDVLRELDAMWRNASNAWVVRQWLRKELEALAGKVVA
jgi:hypothetical protein